MLYISGAKPRQKALTTGCIPASSVVLCCVRRGGMRPLPRMQPGSVRNYFQSRDQESNPPIQPGVKNRQHRRPPLAEDVRAKRGRRGWKEGEANRVDGKAKKSPASGMRMRVLPPPSVARGLVKISPTCIMRAPTRRWRWRGEGQNLGLGGRGGTPGYYALR